MPYPTENAPTTVEAVCSRCRESVQPGEILAGFCLSCLLGAALSEGEAGKDELRFDHYEVLVDGEGQPIELGRGAMGITYRATDTTLRSEVALKVIKPAYTGQPVARERFIREARTAFKLRHPNVASVLYAGISPDNQCFYTMELIDGETVRTRVQRAGPLPVSTARKSQLR